LIATIIGEGGSGGAHRPRGRRQRVDAGARHLLRYHAEGCRHLWKDAGQAPAAAEALKLTAEDLKRLHLIVTVIPEPLGGAHRDPAAAIAMVGEPWQAALEPLLGLDIPLPR